MKTSEENACMYPDQPIQIQPDSIGGRAISWGTMRGSGSGAVR